MAKKKADAKPKAQATPYSQALDDPPPPPAQADMFITKLSDGAGNFVTYTSGVNHARPCFVHGLHNSTSGGLTLTATVSGPGGTFAVPAGQINLNGFDFTVEIRNAQAPMPGLTSVQLVLKSGIFMVGTTMGIITLT